MNVIKRFIYTAKISVRIYDKDFAIKVTVITIHLIL